MSRTVAAVATPSGSGGIGIIRISGDRAIETADRVFRSVSSKKLCDQKGYTALFGHIVSNGEKTDEAVALVFRAPKSYTGEDTVELSVHGGEYVVKKVLRTVLEAGAVMAEKGEFTRRAFENGKMDLAEAEAVMDIISADGEQALRASMSAKQGAISKKCTKIKDELTFAAATVAAFSDYPDEEPEFSGIDGLETMLRNAEEELDRLCRDYDTGRMIRHGINTVIAGSPNAGKSTLMNLLSGFERSIVTPIAGTTRDVIEETVTLGDIVLRLSDTAGLRDSDDEIERLGVRLTRERMESADLVIAVIDGSGEMTDCDRELLRFAAKRPSVAVLNKSDKGFSQSIDGEALGMPYVVMSAKEGTGLEEFVSAVKTVTGTASLGGGASVYLNERQRDCAKRALDSVTEAISALRSGITVDAVGVLIDDALSTLMELTGERVTVEVTDKVFEKFCVGK